MNASWTWETEQKSNDEFDMAVYVNDAEQICKMVSNLSDDNSYPRSASLTFITTLNTGQNIKLKLRGSVAGKSVLVSQFNMSISEL